MSADTEIDNVIAEARGTFDLSARLKGRTLREDSVTIYTDEVAGNLVGGIERPKSLLGVDLDPIRWGILGDIDAALAADPDADVSELRERLIDAKVELEKSAVTFHLRAVPELIVKDARRKALKSYGVKGKVPDENVSDFTSLFNAHLFSHLIVKIADVEGNERPGKLDVEAAADLENFLPRSEYRKLYALLEDVQFKQAIGDSSTADADF